MPGNKPEVADVFRRHGDAWRKKNIGHLSRGQLRVMSAIEKCRTAALGGHVEQCRDCSHIRIAYNSCRNRHCPKCQWAAAERWLEARKAELLPVPYYHVVFTLPAQIGKIAYQNKRKVYGILFKAASETLCTIAADPKHLGAKIGVTGVLHTWGQNLQHHPHVHCIVPGGGVALDGRSWTSCKPGFFLSVRVLSRLFRRLFLQYLSKAFEAGELKFFNELAALKERETFDAYLTPLRKVEWVVYAKRPFAGPEQVLSYLARYTHRVAIANSRIVKLENGRVTFRWKDYRRTRGERRAKRGAGSKNGENAQRTMTVSANDFMRRFLLHVLPDGFHRIRHYGLFANGHRVAKIELCRKLLGTPAPEQQTDNDNHEKEQQATIDPIACPCCGGRMVIIETLDHPFTQTNNHQRKEKWDGL